MRYPVAEKEKRAAEGIVDSNPSPAPTAVQEVPAAPEVLVIDNDDGAAVAPDAAVGERRKKKTKALKAIRTDITADDYIRKHEDTFIYLCKHPPCTYGLSLIAANQLAENTAADVEVTDTGVNDKKGQKGKKGKK